MRRENETFFRGPGATRLGRLAAGTAVATGATRAGHTEVTVEGWVIGSSLRPADREGHTLSVGSAPEENLRQSPNGRVMARLLYGCLLDEVERRGEWVHVRRVVWVASQGLDARPPAVGAASDSPGAGRAAPVAVEAIDPRRAVARRRLMLHRAPDAAAAGTLDAGTSVRVTARAGGWVRVEAAGWVREDEIRLADDGILTDVSAADLRASPEGFRGKVLRWTIQYIALQTADDLRPDFRSGQRYILARGPAPEYAFVYVVVPRAKLDEVARLEPLASVSIVARVLNGRSAYLANPILELLDIAQ